MLRRETSITELKNLSKTTSSWLHAIGITNLGDLEDCGAVAAFKRLEVAGFEPSLEVLYALEGVLVGVDSKTFSAAKRAELKAAIGWQNYQQ